MDDVLKKYLKELTRIDDTFEGYIVGESTYKSFVSELKGLGISFAVRNSRNKQNVKGKSCESQI